jgi:hypothetical protein
MPNSTAQTRFSAAAPARREVRDTLYNGTPADWAEHNHFEKLAAQLRR